MSFSDQLPNMNPWVQKLESEPVPRAKVEVSDPIKDMVVDLVDTTNQSTHLVKAEEHSSGCASDSISLHYTPMKDEDKVDDSQPDNEIDNWTATELLETQQKNHNSFMEEYRTASNQEGYRLSQAVQTGVQNGMDQIVNFLKSVVPRPVQPPTSVEVDNLRDQLKSEKTHNKDLTSHYNRLVKTSNQQQRELQKVNTKLQEALQERDQLRKLLDGGSLANSTKSTDDAIKSKWTEIAYNIRCLTRILGSDPSGQPLDDEIESRLRFISRHYRKYLKDPDFRELIIMGYIWVFIQDTVFEAEKSVWGGPSLKSYKTVQDSLLTRVSERGGEEEPSIAHVARWLAQGSTMMSDMWDKNIKGIKPMLHAESKRLRPFSSDCQSLTDRSDDNAFDQLEDIFYSAVELDQMMMCSKAIFQIHWRDQSQKSGIFELFNPEAMEAEAWDNELSPKSRVQFHISPILYKAGTADGQRYDSRMVLAKSMVVCD